MQTITLIALQPDEDGQQRPPFEVPYGETVIGREPFLQCKHPGVSRSHAKLVIKENGELTLTSIHKKPSYYQRVGDASKTALALNESATLQDGDMFFMIESGCGYRVQISGDSLETEKKTDDTPEEDTASGQTVDTPQPEKSPGKRKFPQWMDEEEPETLPVNPKKTVKKLPENEIRPEPEDSVVADTENLEENVASSATAAHDVSDEDEDQTGSSTVADVDRPEGTGVGDEEEEAQPGPSATPRPPAAAQPQRQPCRYGQACYRKNPQHRLDFSHPGDADFVIPIVPAPGSKPACPYGTSCYRKNPQHIQDYDHTQPPTATSPAKQGRKKRKAAGQKKNTGHYSGSDSNDSYESSFIGSSDEYSPDPNDDDTDEDWD